jgi:hypothetical protein
VDEPLLTGEAGAISGGVAVKELGRRAAADEVEVIAAAVLGEVRRLRYDPAVAVAGAAGVARTVGPAAGVAPGDADAGDAQVINGEGDDAVGDSLS